MIDLSMHQEHSATSCPGRYVVSDWARFEQTLPDDERTPVMRVEGMLEEVSVAGPGQVRVRGWAANGRPPLTVRVYVHADGVRVRTQEVRADKARPDVGAAFPSFGPNHGFNETINIGRAAKTVTVHVDVINPTGDNTGLPGAPGETRNVPPPPAPPEPEPPLPPDTTDTVAVPVSELRSIRQFAEAITAKVDRLL